MKSRGAFQGVLAIVRFNWPFYLVAAVVMLAALAVMFAGGLPFAVKATAGLAFAAAAYFFFVSSAVSHWIYDRSDLYRWKWLDRLADGGDGKREAMADDVHGRRNFPIIRLGIQPGKRQVAGE